MRLIGKLDAGENGYIVLRQLALQRIVGDDRLMMPEDLNHLASTLADDDKRCPIGGVRFI